MNRITEKDLERLVGLINKQLGTPQEAYTEGEDGDFQPQARCHHLSYAYGGVSLHRMCDEGSGIHDVFSCGHVPKRDLYNRMRAFLDGLEAPEIVKEKK